MNKKIGDYVLVEYKTDIYGDDSTSKWAKIVDVFQSSCGWVAVCIGTISYQKFTVKFY